MITNLLLLLIYGIILVITSPLRLLSDVSQPAIFSSTISQANSYLATGYTWLPYMINTLLLTWGLFIALELAIFIYKGFMWIIKKIPGIS